MTKKQQLSLADWRTGAGFSQEGLAEAAGVSRATITHIEGGRNNPSADTARKICEALGKKMGKDIQSHDVWPEVFKKLPV